MSLTRSSIIDAVSLAIVKAKGDLIIGTADGVVARRAVGAVNEVSVADPTDVTGIAWRKVGNAMVATDAAIAGSKLATGVSGPPGAEIQYTEFTAPVSVTSTTEATPDDVVSAGAFTYDGSTKIIIKFWCPALVTPTADAGLLLCNLWDDTTNLGRLTYTRSVGGSALTISSPVIGERILTPTNASHTYKIRAWVFPSGTGSVDAGNGSGAGAQLPGFIRITKA